MFLACSYFFRNLSLDVLISMVLIKKKRVYCLNLLCLSVRPSVSCSAHWTFSRLQASRDHVTSKCLVFLPLRKESIELYNRSRQFWFQCVVRGEFRLSLFAFSSFNPVDELISECQYGLGYFAALLGNIRIKGKIQIFLLEYREVTPNASLTFFQMNRKVKPDVDHRSQVMQICLQIAVVIRQATIRSSFIQTNDLQC